MEILVDVKTKLPLDCFMKISEFVAKRKMKRGKLFESAVTTYIEMMEYVDDRAEYADCKDEDRKKELKRRIDAYELKYKVYEDVF